VSVRVRVLMAWPENYGLPPVGLVLRVGRAAAGEITEIGEDGAVYAEVQEWAVERFPQAADGGVWTVLDGEGNADSA